MESYTLEAIVDGKHCVGIFSGADRDDADRQFRNRFPGTITSWPERIREVVTDFGAA